MNSELQRPLGSATRQLLACRRELASVICACLALACVADAAIAARSLLRAPPTFLLSTNAAIDLPSTKRSPSDADTIITAHLFGRAAAGVAASASESSLVLTGVLADSSDARRGAAILGVTRESARYVTTGDAVSPGLTLTLVYADHVVLDRDGSAELLRLPYGPRKIFQAIASAAQSSAAEPADAPSEGLPSAEELKASISTQSQQLQQIFHATGSFDDEHFHGVTIQPGANAALFASIGFQPGDLITDIDHLPITDPSVLQQFSSGRTIGVGVRRPEGTERIEVDTTKLRAYIGN